MSIAITIGKFICFSSLVVITSVSAVANEETTDGKLFDFEANLPGTFPNEVFNCGWGGANGILGRHVFITNEKGCNSKQSICYKLMPQSEMCGVGFENGAGKRERGLLTFEFDYMREKHGGLGIEIRERYYKWSPVGLGEECSVRLGRNANGRKKVGIIDPYKWYHFVIKLPITKEDGEVGTIEMTDLEKKETLTGEIGTPHPDRSPNFQVLFNALNRQPEMQTFFIDNMRISFK